jgi:hypothetical protein
MEKINLNSIVFNEIITKEDILQHVTQEEVFGFYMGEDIKDLGVFHSPLREDNIPSFALYFHKHNSNTLMFKDFATNDCGDFVVLVMKMFNLNYSNALLKIAYDFKLGDFNVKADKQEITYTNIKQKKRVELGVKLRDWTTKDKKFWTSFGITKSTLQKFNVYPISYVFYNQTAVRTHEYAYVYVEQKDDVVSYKIYQPYESKTKKWINNANYSVHQGYRQLPESGELLIVTKSLKDVMSIHDCLGIPAIGLQSESVMIKPTVMDEYKERFSKVICLFDNDEAGIKLTQEFSKVFGIPYILVPDEYNVTDFSDLVQSQGKDKAVEIFKKLIYG